MTNKITEARRKLFEDEYSRLDQQAAEHLLFIRDDGQYGYHTTRVAWACFNAALDAVEIELPKEFDRRDVQGLDYDEVIAAIESTNLGLRVK